MRTKLGQLRMRRKWSASIRFGSWSLEPFSFLGIGSGSMLFVQVVPYFELGMRDYRLERDMVKMYSSHVTCSLCSLHALPISMESNYTCEQHTLCDLSATQQNTCFLFPIFVPCHSTCCSCYLLPTKSQTAHDVYYTHALLNYCRRHLSTCWCSDCWHKFVPSDAAHLHCTPMQITILIHAAVFEVQSQPSSLTTVYRITRMPICFVLQQKQIQANRLHAFITCIWCYSCICLGT